MNDINKIRVELCKMNCRVHMKLPHIVRNGEELEYHTCCDAFTLRLQARYTELVNEAPVKFSPRRSNK